MFRMLISPKKLPSPSTANWVTPSSATTASFPSLMIYISCPTSPFLHTYSPGLYTYTNNKRNFTVLYRQIWTSNLYYSKIYILTCGVSFSTSSSSRLLSQFWKMVTFDRVGRCTLTAMAVCSVTGSCWRISFSRVIFLFQNRSKCLTKLLCCTKMICVQ